MKLKPISLNGEWTLFYGKNSRITTDSLCLRSSTDLKAFSSIAATVPGNPELDFQSAGLTDDPYYSDNILKTRQFECMHYFYCKKFSYNGTGKNLFLVFEGIDTFADIYLNGELIGSSENMFISYEFPIKGLHVGENELTVHIKPTTIESRKYEVAASSFANRYNYDSLYVRKAASMFGWDITPRLISGGLWRDVYIEEKNDERIENVFAYTVKTDTETHHAELIFLYNLKLTGDDISIYKVRVYGVCNESVFDISERLWHTSGRLTLNKDNMKLWFPRNYGEPYLYDTVFELYKDEELIDSYKWRLGIRTVNLDRTSTTDENGKGEFCIYINDIRIFAMGTNWVPVDAFHSNDVKRLPDILPMLNELGCNIVRCWGGNVYEHENFFDFCDANGIMVWQDFAMACAVYPQDRTFCEMLEPEVVSVVKKYRNHASLCIWAGDNECDCAFMSWSGTKRDPNDNIITRRVIPELLKIYDFTRPYLPSSPYIDEEAYKSGKPTSEDHCWGPRDYFKGEYYKNTVCHFASETGYHGCPSPESLKKFISKEELWPCYDNNTKRFNDDWIVHAASPETGNGIYAYRIPLMINQVKTLFGFVPESLDDFSLASQISQAEAKKYFIERFRLSKWRRTGIIWWNLIDGWPQISDSIVDYYFDKKLAYYYIKRSQQPICLMCDEDNEVITLYGVNDSRKNVTVSYNIRNLTEEKKILSGSTTLEADTSICITRIKKNNGEQNFYLIEWNGDSEGKNHFMSGMPLIDFAVYRRILKNNKLDG